MSCDLADQADSDCAGINAGGAYIDNCGACVGGTTGLAENYAMNSCGDCYSDDSSVCSDCGSSNAINYNVLADETLEDWDGLLLHDESLCIYDMCSDYILQDDEFSCTSDNESMRPYQIGTQLSCDDINMDFLPCYPECDNAFSFSDFNGKVFWLLYEEDW